MQNDDGSNANSNADEDADRHRRTAASTPPDTLDHTPHHTLRHTLQRALNDVTGGSEWSAGRRPGCETSAVSNHRRLLLSPLLLLVALITVLATGTVSASAAHRSETRVRAIATVTADAVGQPSSETAGHVGCLRPVQPAIVSGSCVATKADSPVWQSLKPFRGKTKTNGLSGSKKEFYEWDYTHCDIEVYDKNGKHKGSMDPRTGEMIKPAVPGYEIDI